MGPPLRHGRADPFPRRLRDQPVHGSRGPARPGAGAGPVARPGRDAARARRPGRRHRAASGRPRHGLRDEPRPRARRLDRSSAWCSRTCATPSAGWRPRPRRAWFAEHGWSTSYVGRDGVGAHLEAGDAFAFGGDLRRRLRPAHRGARAQAPRRRPGRPRPRAADHPPGDVPPRPGLLPARRPPRAGLPRGARRAVRRGAARPGARAAGAHRGGGADDVLRQLRGRRLDRGDARLPRPGPGAAGGSGASRSSWSTSPSSTSAAARSAA